MSQDPPAASAFSPKYTPQKKHHAWLLSAKYHVQTNLRCKSFCWSRGHLPQSGALGSGKAEHGSCQGGLGWTLREIPLGVVVQSWAPEMSIVAHKGHGQTSYAKPNSRLIKTMCNPGRIPLNGVVTVAHRLQSLGASAGPKFS